MVNKYSLNSVSADLRDFDVLAKKDDFIEVTEWHNGEGYDITINERKFLLTDGELEAINHLIRVLKYESSGNE